MKKYTIIFKWIFTELQEKQLQDLAGFAIIAGIRWRIGPLNCGKEAVCVREELYPGEQKADKIAQARHGNLLYRHGDFLRCGAAAGALLAGSGGNRRDTGAVCAVSAGPQPPRQNDSGIHPIRLQYLGSNIPRRSTAAGCADSAGRQCDYLGKPWLQ